MRTKNDRERLKGALRSTFHYSWVLFSKSSPESLSTIKWHLRYWTCEMGLDTSSIWSLKGWQCTLPAELVSYPRVWLLSSDVLLFSNAFKRLSLLPKEWGRTSRLTSAVGCAIYLQKTSQPIWERTGRSGKGI